MTESTRAKAGRRPRRSASQLFIAALVVFGIAASVLLLFSENIQWLRVGLVSALWAAIVGAFAMTKYRREAVADQTKAKDLQTVYELQLAREISARREYELGVEARVRSEVQLETSEVAALRAELAHLRNNLQMLFDGNLPTERVALRAEATRVQELGGGRNYNGYQPAPSGLYVPGSVPYGASPSGAADDGIVDRPIPGLATPYDEPVTAETSVLYPDSPIGSVPPNGYRIEAEPKPPRSGRPSDADEPARRRPTPPRTTPSYQPTPGYEQTPSYDQTPSFDRTPSFDQTREGSESPVGSGSPFAAGTPDFAVIPDAPASPESTDGREYDIADAYVEAEPAVDEAEPAVDEAEPAVSEPAVAEAEPAVVTDDTTSGDWDLPEPSPRRRRRADPDEAAASGAHSNGRSVADILAGLQSSEGEPSARRHRRRAD